MPNTEVKPSYTDNTWLATAREDRQLPDSKQKSTHTSAFLFGVPHSHASYHTHLFLFFFKGETFLFTRKDKVSPFDPLPKKSGNGDDLSDGKNFELSFCFTIA